MNNFALYHSTRSTHVRYNVWNSWRCNVWHKASCCRCSSKLLFCISIRLSSRFIGHLLDMSDIPRVVYQLSPRSDDGLSLDPMDQMDQMGNSLPRWERRINRSGAHPMAEHKSRSDRDDMNVANSSESHHNQDNFFRRPNTNILVYDEDRGRNSNLHNTPERRSCLVKQSPARHNGIEKIKTTLLLS